MTNSNYLLYTKSNKYVLRIPKKINAKLINRRHEKINSELTSKININVDTLYFDEITGIKLTKFIENGITLNKESFNTQNILLKLVTSIHSLHHSNIKLSNIFNIFSEFEHYQSLLKNNKNLLKYNKAPDLISFFSYIKNNYNFLFKSLVPCHNDLVPENLILDRDNLFIIDWEYSGMNNPLFDISSLFIEGDFDDYQKDFFLENYFNKDYYIKNKYKILLDINVYHFLQDILWFLWTIIKEENNESFGDYAKIRLERAIKTKGDLLNKC